MLVMMMLSGMGSMTKSLEALMIGCSVSAFVFKLFEWPCNQLRITYLRKDDYPPFFVVPPFDE